MCMYMYMVYVYVIFIFICIFIYIYIYIYNIYILSVMSFLKLWQEKSCSTSHSLSLNFRAIVVQFHLTAFCPCSIVIPFCPEKKIISVC